MSIRQQNSINKKKLVHSKHGWMTYSSFILSGMAMAAVGSSMDTANADSIDSAKEGQSSETQVMDSQVQTAKDIVSSAKSSESQSTQSDVKVPEQVASSVSVNQDASKITSQDTDANKQVSNTDSRTSSKQEVIANASNETETKQNNASSSVNEKVQSQVSSQGQTVETPKASVSSSSEKQQVQSQENEQTKVTTSASSSVESKEQSSQENKQQFNDGFGPSEGVDINKQQDGYQTILSFQSGATEASAPTKQDWDNYKSSYNGLQDVQYKGTVHYMNNGKEVGSRVITDNAKQGDTDVIYNSDVMNNSLLRKYGWQVPSDQIMGSNQFVFDPKHMTQDWYINVVHAANDNEPQTGFTLPELNYVANAKDMTDHRVYKKTNDLQKENNVTFSYVDQNKEHNRTENVKINFVDENGNVVSSQDVSLKYNQVGQIQDGLNKISTPSGYVTVDGNDYVDSFNDKAYQGINIKVKKSASTLSTDNQNTDVPEPSGVLSFVKSDDPESVKEFQEAWKDYQALPDEQVKLDVKYVDDDGNTVGTKEVIDNKKQGDYDVLWIRDILDSDALNKEGWHLSTTDKSSWDDNKSGTVIVHVHKILGQDAKSGFTLPTVTYSYDLSKGKSPYYRSNSLYGSIDGNKTSDSPIKEGHKLSKSLLDQGPIALLPKKDKNFVDQSGKTVGTVLAKDCKACMDGCVTYDAIKVQAPSGYVFKDNGKSVGYTTPDATTLDVVSADSSSQTPVKHGLHVDIEYKTSDGKVVGTKEFNFDDKDSSDAKNHFETKGATENTIKENIPSGYQMVRWTSYTILFGTGSASDATTSGSDATHIAVEVEPVSDSNQTGSSTTPSSDDIQVTINYKDGSNTIKTANETIKSGDTLDVMKDMPSGYQPTSDFKPGNLNVVDGKATIDVPVQKTQSSNTNNGSQTSNNTGSNTGNVVIPGNPVDGSNTNTNETDLTVNITYTDENGNKVGSKDYSYDKDPDKTELNKWNNDKDYVLQQIKSNLPSGYELKEYTSRTTGPGLTNDGKETGSTVISIIATVNKASQTGSSTNNGSISDKPSSGDSSSTNKPSNGGSQVNPGTDGPSDSGSDITKPDQNTSSNSPNHKDTSTGQANNNKAPAGSIGSNNADNSKNNGSETNESKSSEQPSVVVPQDKNDATNSDIYPGEGILPDSNGHQVSRGDLPKPTESNTNNSKKDEKNSSSQVGTSESTQNNVSNAQSESSMVQPKVIIPSSRANEGQSMSKVAYEGVDQEGRTVEVEKQNSDTAIVETHYGEKVQTNSQVGLSVSASSNAETTTNRSSQIGGSSSDVELPQTGDSTNTLAELGLISLAGLGLIGLRRKED